MTEVPRAFVLDAPGRLSERAVEFLRRSARRVPFDRGLAGGRLSMEIERVYGRPREDFVRLLEGVQSRYGGLTYDSGFFQGPVQFSPVCEPEDAEDELEILYALETGSPAGGSVKADGQVEIGIDGAGVVEFPDLDTFIECDAMFDAAGRLPVEDRFYLDRSGLARAVSRLSEAADEDLQPVPIAGGAHCYWFQSPSLVAFVCGTWSELGGALSPFVQLWGESMSQLGRCRRLLA
ncbi:hypothetical protein [Micromonospora humida]|uniref:hypothetical protein n=1 Tax=Micromonospora humida TaxID=2809018 RepID=UPI0033DE79D3